MTRVLIADDHPFLRSGVQSLLRNSRYEVVAVVGNGLEAIAAIDTCDPEVLIVDVNMPPPDGVELVEQLRARQDHRPVLLLTAQIDDQRLLRAIRAGVAGIILKDGAEENLLHCLNTVMSGQKSIPAELLERALHLSLARDQGALRELTQRERDIVKLVRQGLRNREIADRLAMSEGTVKVYLHDIYRKLGVTNRTELAILDVGDFD